MFEVVSKKTGNTITVYSAVEEKKTGYVKFLVYEDNGWRWKSAKHYRPVFHSEISYEDVIGRMVDHMIDNNCPDDIGLSTGSTKCADNCKSCWDSVLNKK